MSQGNKGYIKIYRQLQDCWIWDSDERHNRRSAWIDLLMLANHADKKILFDNKVITIQRGQYLTSIRKLAERWKWAKSTVTTFLNLLESDNMIKRESDSKRTLITIVNYEVFQEKQSDAKTDNRTECRTDSGTNKNEKNDKEDYIYLVGFEETYKIYPRKGDRKRAYACYQTRLKEGYSEEELYAATKNYAEYCKRENREQRYIKLASTFFGVNTPFVDYIPKDIKPGIDTSRIFDLQAQYEYPYFGFPKEWFEGDRLIHERITSVIRPCNPSLGWYEESEIGVDDLLYEYNTRRSYYEQNNNSG